MWNVSFVKIQGIFFFGGGGVDLICQSYPGLTIKAFYLHFFHQISLCWYHTYLPTLTHLYFFVTYKRRSRLVKCLLFKMCLDICHPFEVWSFKTTKSKPEKTSEVLWSRIHVIYCLLPKHSRVWSVNTTKPMMKQGFVLLGVSFSSLTYKPKYIIELHIVYPNIPNSEQNEL